MIGHGVDGGPRPFGPGELDGVADVAPGELPADTRVARDLEALATRTGGAPTLGFVDRVMAAVEAEPVAAPARVAGLALRRGAFGAFVAAIVDAWRVITRPAFPAAVRAQALALVLVVAGLLAGSGIAAAGALGLLNGDGRVPSPPPSLEAPSVPSVVPSPVAPSPMAPDGSLEPSESPEPSESADDASPEPTETARPAETGDDHVGDDRSGGGSGKDSGPSPTKTPSSGSGHDDGDDGEDDHHDSETQTPKPTETPQATDDSSGSDDD